MNFSRSAIALYVSLVFLSGAAVGGFGYRLFTAASMTSPGAKENEPPRNSEEGRKRFMTGLQDRLKLSGDQLAKLSAIMDETRAKMHTLQDAQRSQVEALRKEESAKVMAILSSDQQAEYQKMLKEREERAKQRSGRSRGDSGRGNGPR